MMQNIIHQKIINVSSKIPFFYHYGALSATENEFQGFGNLVIWLWKSLDLNFWNLQQQMQPRSGNCDTRIELLGFVKQTMDVVSTLFPIGSKVSL